MTDIPMKKDAQHSGFRISILDFLLSGIFVFFYVLSVVAPDSRVGQIADDRMFVLLLLLVLLSDLENFLNKSKVEALRRRFLELVDSFTPLEELKKKNTFDD